MIYKYRSPIYYDGVTYVKNYLQIIGAFNEEARPHLLCRLLKSLDQIPLFLCEQGHSSLSFVTVFFESCLMCNVCHHQ